MKINETSTRGKWLDKEKVMIQAAIIFFILVIVASAAFSDPKIKAVPPQGKQKIDSTSSPPANTDLIKTEKTIEDKNCRMVHGKMECARKSKHIKRKTIN